MGAPGEIHATGVEFDTGCEPVSCRMSRSVELAFERVAAKKAGFPIRLEHAPEACSASRKRKLLKTGMIEWY